MPREWQVAAYHLHVVNGDRFGCVNKTLPFADPNREEFRMAMELKLFRNAGQSQRSRFVVLVVGCFLVSMTFMVVSRPLTSSSPLTPNMSFCSLALRSVQCCVLRDQLAARGHDQYPRMLLPRIDSADPWPPMVMMSLLFLASFFSCEVGFIRRLVATYLSTLL
ncbi:hypothetical protein MUK42_30097 [Musa troglodytarum]|uniref:Transmembrane protein n=1 Tax=Musa troglodytarum TaxID=320322 RepID=A0A9E7GAG3_9LILI|nr:hypothetical protein MUK42_30097 [Musa troglodytarum]